MRPACAAQARSLRYLVVTLAFHRIEPAGTKRDTGSPKVEQAGASESNALQLHQRQL